MFISILSMFFYCFLVLLLINSLPTRVFPFGLSVPWTTISLLLFTYSVLYSSLFLSLFLSLARSPSLFYTNKSTHRDTYASTIPNQLIHYSVSLFNILFPTRRYKTDMFGTLSSLEQLVYVTAPSLDIKQSLKTNILMTHNCPNR